MPEPDLVTLLREVLAGSPQASQQFLDMYGPELLRAVRRRLPKQLRPQFDSLDFVQDVWSSFFAGERHEFNSSDELVAYLTRLARNKVVDTVRQRLQTQKHNVNREQHEAFSPNDSTAASFQVLDRQPTPSKAVIEQEEWDRLLRAQPPVYRKVLLLLRQGKTIKQVSDEMGISERTIGRIISRVAERLSFAAGEW